MNISQKTIWLAVHALFRARRTAVGGSLPLKDMMDGWTDCKLRQSDLAQGLEALAAAGHVHLGVTRRGPFVRLLDARFGRIDCAEDRAAAADLVTIRELRSRPAPTPDGPPPAAGRRREDALGAYAVAA